MKPRDAKTKKKNANFKQLSMKANEPLKKKQRRGANTIREKIASVMTIRKGTNKTKTTASARPNSTRRGNDFMNPYLLNNLPGDARISRLEAEEEAKEKAIAQFVEYYNYQQYHESLNNLTPSDVYHGKPEKILNERERIKQETIKTGEGIIIRKNTRR